MAAASPVAGGTLTVVPKMTGLLRQVQVGDLVLVFARLEGFTAQYECQTSVELQHTVPHNHLSYRSWLRMC